MEELLLQWHAQLMNPERIPVVLAALLLCAVAGMVTGPVAGNTGPFSWIVLDTLLGRFGERLDRPRRRRADLTLRGLSLCLFVIVLSALAGRGMAMLAAAEPLWGAMQVILLSLLMTCGSVWFALLRLYFAMEQKKAGQGAYYAIARSARVNLTAGDDFGVSRAALGLAATGFDKGLVAPALWFIIGGFPAACIHAGLAMLAWRYGKRGFSKGFGDAALALERLMGFVPSALAGLYLALAALFTPTARLHRGVAAFMGNKNRAPYEQGGMPLSAMAWSLDIGLGGAVQDLSGAPLPCVWTGPAGASAKTGHAHLRRGLYISAVAHLLFAASLLGMYMWAGILAGGQGGMKPF